jgi:hypothetical protein
MVPRQAAAGILSVFSGVRTVVTAPSGFCPLQKPKIAILYPVLDGFVIRNRYVPPVVKMSSEYSLH